MSDSKEVQQFETIVKLAKQQPHFCRKWCRRCHRITLHVVFYGDGVDAPYCEEHEDEPQVLK